MKRAGRKALEEFFAQPIDCVLLDRTKVIPQELLSYTSAQIYAMNH